MRPIYRESMYLPGWVGLLLTGNLAGCLAIYLALRPTVAADAPSLVWVWDLIWMICVGASIAAPLAFGRMLVSVDTGVLNIHYGLVSLIRKQIPLELIESAEPVSYRPIRDFGGWGIRRGRYRGCQTAAYSLRGKDGVLLRLKVPIDAVFCRTDKVLIGSVNHLSLATFLSGAAS